MIFEKKSQDEDTWKLYKRAYKKYYARYMKRNMGADDFKAWAMQAALARDEAIRKIEETEDAGKKARKKSAKMERCLRIPFRLLHYTTEAVRLVSSRTASEAQRSKSRRVSRANL